MQSMNTRNSKRDIFLLLILLVIYATTATIYELPAGGLLRWGSCILLVVYHVFYAIAANEGKVVLLPKEFLFLFFPFAVQSFWNFEYIELALSRSLSFILYSMALYSLVNKPYMSSFRIKELYKTYSWITVLMVVLLNVINISNYSLNGDFYGIYANRTVTSCVLLSTLALTFLLLVQTRLKICKAVLIMFLILETYMLFTTHSRMAFLGFAFLVIAILFSIQTSLGLRGKLLISLLIVAFAVIIPYLGIVYNIEAIVRVFSVQNEMGSMGIGRNTWQIGFDLIRQKPLLGWGNNSVYYNTFINNAGGWGWGVHNSYLVMLVEGGIIGFAFYTLFFWSFFHSIIRKYKYCKIINLTYEEVLFVKILLVLSATLALNGMSESFLFSAGNVEGLPFWFSLFTLYAYMSRKMKETQYN